MTVDRPFTTKTDWVYNRLRAEILDGTLKPEDRLRLTSLARRFDISEMPVREALRMLQQEGLVAFANHRGATVIELSWQRAAEVVAVRMHLEVLAVREAMPGHDAGSLTGLTRILDRMDRHAEAGAAERFSAGNREFHSALYAPCCNEILKQEIQMLWDRVWRARARSIFDRDPPRMKAAQMEHRAVMAAVRSGDAEAASRAMTRHRANTLASWARTAAAHSASTPSPARDPHPARAHGRADLSRER